MPIILKDIPELTEATVLQDSDVTIIGEAYDDIIYKRNLASIAAHTVESNRDAIANTVGTRKLKDNSNFTSMDLPDIVTTWHAPYFPHRASAMVSTDFNPTVAVEWQAWHPIPYKYIEYDQGGLAISYPELFPDRQHGLLGFPFRLPLINPTIAPLSLYYITASLVLYPCTTALSNFRFRMYIGIHEGEPGHPSVQIWSARYREFWLEYLPSGSVCGMGDTVMYFEYNRASGPHHWVVPYFTMNFFPGVVFDMTVSKFSIVKVN